MSGSQSITSSVVLLLDPIVDHLPVVENRELYNKSEEVSEKTNEISALATFRH
ncbi:hypothetical protein [Collimonas sp.]|uniref:hypothetical protein n=1 Tax=Collimonas sp. TaxID=1963772 RepID=UPI0037BF3FBE